MPEDGGGERAEPGLVSQLTPDVIRQRFALKFALVFLVLGVSVGLVGFAATEQLRDQTRANVQEEYRNVAIQESDIVEQWLERNELSTQLVSSDDAWSGGDRMETTLQNEKANLPAGVEHMHLVEQSLSRTTVAASTASVRHESFATGERAWTAEASFEDTSQVIRSSVYRDGDGTPVIGFLSPVPAENRLLLVEYRLDGVADSLQGAERERGGFTQMVNASGTVLIDEPREGSNRLGQHVLTSYGGDGASPVSRAEQLRDDSDSNARVVESATIDDTKYTVGYSPVSGTDWVVLVHAPYDAVFGFVDQVQTWGMVATAAVVLLIGGVGTTLGYSTTSAIDDLRRRTEEMREGNLDVDIESHRIDAIGQLYDAFGEMRDALRDQVEEAERARKAAEVSRAEAVEMNEYLEEKAAEFGETMGEAAAGDFTRRMTTDGENDAMDHIAREFNRMLEELEKTTGQLKNFHEEVAESSAVVGQSADSVRQAASQVAESVQRISDDADAQRETLESVAGDMADLVEALEDLLASSDDVDVSDQIDRFRDVAAAMEAATETSRDMRGAAEQVADAAEEQAAELDEVSSRADRLERYARPLGDILERFETDAEHEFVFSGGPSQSTCSVGEND